MDAGRERWRNWLKVMVTVVVLTVAGVALAKDAQQPPVVTSMPPQVRTATPGPTATEPATLTPMMIPSPTATWTPVATTNPSATPVFWGIGTPIPEATQLGGEPPDRLVRCTASTGHKCNLRACDDMTCMVVTQVQSGKTLPLAVGYQGGDWWRVELADGSLAWASRECFRFEVSE
jgi:hypothetical protein